MVINSQTNINTLSWPPDSPILKNNAYKTFICSYCKNVLVNVHQADDCGCRFCYECLDEIFRKKIKTCPSCHFNFASEVYNSLY